MKISFEKDKGLEFGELLAMRRGSAMVQMKDGTKRMVLSEQIMEIADTLTWGENLKPCSHPLSALSFNLLTGDGIPFPDYHNPGSRFCHKCKTSWTKKGERWEEDE